MINTRPSSLLCISGGADSMYLLHCYKDVANIHVATVNYNIRSDSHLDTQIVSDYCNLHSIPCHVLNTHPIKDTGIEEWARDVRYTFFNKLKCEFNLDNIVTAHHAGDQAETVLMRLYRGTGIAGLAGIYHDSHSLYRPMLGLKKDFIYAECKRLSIPYREDSTNVDVKYLRNWFRHEYVEDEMVDTLCDIARKTQDLMPKLLSMAEMIFIDDVVVKDNLILIAKSVDKDSLLFLYLAKLMSSRYKLNEKMFNQIFSDDPTLNKFTTTEFICNKRKKKWIEIKLLEL